MLLVRTRLRGDLSLDRHWIDITARDIAIGGALTLDYREFERCPADGSSFTPSPAACG